MPLRARLRLRFLWALLAVLAVTPAWSVRAADDAEDRRARIGLRLFRTALAADIDLKAKVATDGQLRLLVVHADQPERAKAFAGELAQTGGGEKSGRIREWPFLVAVSNELTADALARQRPAGIYIVQDLPPKALAEVIAYGIREHVIVYSAIEGHVEKGVLGGLDVGVRVLPYINTATLKASQVHLKDLFLKVAKQHE
jgi:hypothetical protein